MSELQYDSLVRPHLSITEGVIPSRDEETEWINDSQSKRERIIGIIIRYVSAPIILLIAMIVAGLLIK